MSLTQWFGICIIWLILTSVISLLVYKEYCRIRFNFNLLFSLLYLVTFFFGFPLTSILIFKFNITPVSPMGLLETLLAAGIFYGIYYATYQYRLVPTQNIRREISLFSMNAVETKFVCGLLLSVAVGSATIFCVKNGFLLFKLHSYSQIFSNQVSLVALKRFFYFFIPAMLIVYFSRQTKSAWLFFLLTTSLFGLVTYVLVGGTRANMMIAVTLFLLIGIARGWISLRVLILSGILGIIGMYCLALQRYHLNVHGDEAFYTFLYLTRDTFSPWENLALLFQHYHEITFQGLAPIARDFYVFIPKWLWPERPNEVLNTANYFTWEVLNNHSGLAISPTLIGSFIVMGGIGVIPLGAVVVGGIVRGFDWLYQHAQRESNRDKASILYAFCFGAIFNMIVLVREGIDAFTSRILFFIAIFVGCIFLAKLCYRLLCVIGLAEISTTSHHKKE